ncbi:MAG: TetR/AcrR family transcriptional regulator [Hyphomonadaceae bacterium]|nr:TetR/AcrR family transcriptional regulator [Hyphomonadaceae bacterium]
MKPGKAAASVAPVASAEGEAADGRLLRGERSRQQIVDALLKLIRSGEMSPSAAQVAQAANVSLRTVFRHFEEMDSLRMEMTAQMEAEIRPILQEPFDAPDWRGRLGQLIARRARIYEHVMPVKVAASLRRFQSAYLRKDYDRFLTLERAGLHTVLPKAVISDVVLFSAIEMATSFQAWRRMRQDQGLSAAEAERVLRYTVDRLIADQ